MVMFNTVVIGPDTLIKGIPKDKPNMDLLAAKLNDLVRSSGCVVAVTFMHDDSCPLLDGGVRCDCTTLDAHVQVSGP
jgi:hypothetical protein